MAKPAEGFYSTGNEASPSCRSRLAEIICHFRDSKQQLSFRRDDEAVLRRGSFSRESFNNAGKPPWLPDGEAIGKLGGFPELQRVWCKQVRGRAPYI